MFNTFNLDMVKYRICLFLEKLITFLSLNDKAIMIIIIKGMYDMKNLNTVLCISELLATPPPPRNKVDLLPGGGGGGHLSVERWPLNKS